MSIAKAIESLLKFAGLIAAFGYMSLRAHFNVLGISSTTSLGTERYLMEAYSLFSFFLFVAFFYYLPLLIVASLTVTLFLKNQHLQALTSRFSKHGSFLMPLVLLLLSLLLSIFVMRYESRVDHDAVLGCLECKDHSRQVAGQPERLFVVSLFSCMLTYVFASRFSRTSNTRLLAPMDAGLNSLWLGACGCAIFLAFNLPTLYGESLHPTTYALIDLVHADKQSMCGALLLENQTHLAVWNVDEGIGKISYVAKDKISRFDVLGSIEVMEAARHGPYPNCSKSK